VLPAFFALISRSESVSRNFQLKRRPRCADSFSMSLTDDQKKQVTRWLQDGAKLSDVQTRLEKEFAIRMTYMDVRFLVDDLKVLPKDAEQPKSPEPALQKSAAPLASAAAQTAAKPAPAPLAPGPQAPPEKKVSVTVDTVVRPGAMISGNVTFSDGKVVGWYLDQFGRLGLAPKDKGYRPSQEDLEEFQIALQDELAKQGY
jgi:hypothetical protein